MTIHPEVGLPTNELEPVADRVPASRFRVETTDQRLYNLCIPLDRDTCARSTFHVELWVHGESAPSSDTGSGDNFFSALYCLAEDDFQS